MPGIIVHTWLAARLLDAWREGRGAAPFALDDPAVESVFRSGAVGPDMGMYPGGESLFSDLAHYVRSGELTRVLIRSASTDAERAFAWGWATHVLADAWIHPLINVAAGDAAEGARHGRPLTFADDPLLHLAIETGVDGAYFATWSERKFSAWPTPPLHLIPWLKRGYDQVYGDCVAVDAMEKSLLAWGKWHRFSMAIAGAASSRLYGRTRGHHGAQGWVRLAAKLATSVFSRRSALHALTHPLRPSERAAALIDEAASGFVERFLEQQRDDFASLPDYNLDTGLVESPAAPTYPLTVATLQRIGRPTAVLAPSERS